MVNILQYTDGTDVIHRLNPVVKLAGATALIIATLTGNYYFTLGMVLVGVVLVASITRVLHQVLLLMRFLIPLAVSMGLLSICLSYGFSWERIAVDPEAFHRSCKGALKLLTLALPLATTMMITRPHDLANACVQILHVPYRYAYTFTTVLRFIPLLAEEMHAITEAQLTRGLDLQTKNPFKKFSLMLPLCIPLLLHAVRKTDVSALATEQRGFYLRNTQSSYKRYPLLLADWIALIVCIAIVIMGIIY